MHYANGDGSRDDGRSRLPGDVSRVKQHSSVSPPLPNVNGRTEIPGSRPFPFSRIGRITMILCDMTLTVGSEQSRHTGFVISLRRYADLQKYLAR